MCSPILKNWLKISFKQSYEPYTQTMGVNVLDCHIFLAQHGISHMTSPPHKPEYNGITERRHRHFVEMGLSLLSHASTLKSYWTYALTAV